MDHFKFDKVTLPKFCHSHWLEDIEFSASFNDNGHSAYDAILAGRNFLVRAGIDVKLSSKEIVWDENTILFHPWLHPVLLPSIPAR